MTCEHRDSTVELVDIIANGDARVWLGCPRCKAPLGPKRSIKLDAIGDREIVRDSRHARPPCQVCGKFGTEEHHWYPRALNREIAERWPKAWLCTDCHRYWHNLMRRYFTSPHPEQLPFGDEEAG